MQAAQTYSMTGARRTAVSRGLGSPHIVERMAGPQRGTVRLGAHLQGTVSAQELGQLHYRIGQRRLHAGDFTVTDHLATFPAEYSDSDHPSKMAWLVVDHPDMKDQKVVLAVVNCETKASPFRNVSITVYESLTLISCEVWNAAKQSYEAQQFDLVLAGDGSLIVQGLRDEPRDAILASVCRFTDLVGRGDGWASVIYTMDTARYQEVVATNDSAHHIPDDLAFLAPAVHRLASGPRPLLDRARPVDAYLNGSGPKSAVSAAIATVQGRVAQVYGAVPAPQWEGAPLDRTRFLRMIAGEADRQTRHQLAGASGRHWLERHRAEGGLFSHISQLNQAARAAGFAGGFAEYITQTHAGLSVEAFIASAHAYAQATAARRQTFLARIKEAHDGAPVHEYDFDYLVGSLHDPVEFTLDQWLTGMRRFYKDLGFDLESGFHAAMTYDLIARKGKMGNLANVPMSGTRWWMTGNLNPDAVSLAEGAALVHEQGHAIDFGLGSLPFGGAYYLLHTVSPLSWREGYSFAMEQLVYRRNWLRRYMDPNHEQYREGVLERVSEIEEEALVFANLRRYGAALQELALYDESRSLAERLQAYAVFRNNQIGLVGAASHESGWIWSDRPHFRTAIGTTAAYAHGVVNYGGPFVEGVAQAVAANDIAALAREGAMMKNVLTHGAWMQDPASTRAVMQHFMG